MRRPVYAALFSLLATSGWGDPAVSTPVTRPAEPFSTASLPAHLATLRQNPADAQSHLYISMIAKELASEQQAKVKASRLQIMSEAAGYLEERGLENSRLKNAVDALEHEEVRSKEMVQRTRCEEIRLERKLGHLIPAFDMALQLFAQDTANQEIIREISELQAAVTKTLRSTNDLSTEDRYILSGFYSYSRADYAEALALWNKAKAVGAQSPSSQSSSELSRITPYEQVAQSHVNEGHRRQVLAGAFERGKALYQKSKFIEALATFRELAIAEPDYPELAGYLVRAEAAAEKDRTRRLSEQKREEIARKLEEGRLFLEKEKYSDAEKCFQALLALDSTHPQAHSYLALVQAELKKRNDPRAAQEHYEAGLVAYASGKLEDAVREWRTSVKLDQRHQKAQNALAKAQKELALNRDLP